MAVHPYKHTDKPPRLKYKLLNRCPDRIRYSRYVKAFVERNLVMEFSTFFIIYAITPYYLVKGFDISYIPAFFINMFAQIIMSALCLGMSNAKIRQRYYMIYNDDVVIKDRIACCYGILSLILSLIFGQHGYGVSYNFKPITDNLVLYNNVFNDIEKKIILSIYNRSRSYNNQIKNLGMIPFLNRGNLIMILDYVFSTPESERVYMRDIHIAVFNNFRIYISKERLVKHVRRINYKLQYNRNI